MSLKPLNGVGRSLIFRLSAWYAAVFSLSAIVLFILLYLLLASAIEHNDREIIEARLRECAAVYENGGVRALDDLVAQRRESPNTKAFFVRLTGRFGNVLVLSAPQELLRFDPSKQAADDGDSGPAWLRIPDDEQRDFTVGSARLPE